MIDEKKIELIKKLQRLAERGVGGEKEGAQKKLQQLMKKYDIETSAGKGKSFHNKLSERRKVQLR